MTSNEGRAQCVYVVLPCNTATATRCMLASIRSPPRADVAKGQQGFPNGGGTSAVAPHAATFDSQEGFASGPRQAASRPWRAGAAEAVPRQVVHARRKGVA